MRDQDTVAKIAQKIEKDETAWRSALAGNDMTGQQQSLEKLKQDCLSILPKQHNLDHKQTETDAEAVCKQLVDDSKNGLPTLIIYDKSTDQIKIDPQKRIFEEIVASMSEFSKKFAESNQCSIRDAISRDADAIAKNDFDSVSKDLRSIYLISKKSAEANAIFAFRDAINNILEQRNLGIRCEFVSVQKPEHYDQKKPIAKAQIYKGDIVKAKFDIP